MGAARWAGAASSRGDIVGLRERIEHIVVIFPENRSFDHYDEGGGFWDHVPPPKPDAYGCGTRIPALLVSPWAQRGYVDHRVADSTSVLAFIEARFGLPPLQARDAAAYNLLDGMTFTGSPREARFG